MVYDTSKVEREILKFWEDKKIYEKLKKRNKKGQNFYFLQGPPYTSGRLHIAHAWNNALKDVALRYKRMRGFNVWDRAGYDMHGLPTENKVQANLGLKFKEDIVKFGVSKFVKECIKFSVENAKLMDKDLWRLGIWMDYPNAYYPIKNSFIEGEWWLIKKAFEDHRLYKGKKIMHWCSSCETALAKHELEYEKDKDNSIFLKFKVKGKENEYLIIWTTTPWTIAFNLAVMVNPELDYVKAKVDNEVWIIAKGLAGTFLGVVLNKPLVILEEFKGEELEGLRYEHPLYEELEEQFDNIARKSKNLHTVTLSEQYVTLEAGTGLVHCAPGCGPEDFEVGKEYGLPPFNELNEKGQFENMAEFDGWIAKVDDPKFINLFKEKDCLIETKEVEHEYAHCWRCHKPVVFRAIEQWFMKVEDLVPDMLKTADSIKWVPKFGSQSFENWIKSLKDNSIVRQRFWGAPAPIWECDKCGKVTVVGSAKELQEKSSGHVPSNLHKPWIDEVKIKCDCGNEAVRVPDVIDVWIDSGTLSWNCLDYPFRKDLFKKLFPADFILEATEQVKLWFSMLHICSMIAMNKPCFKNVYMHGMILDYQGMKMSKSLGNIISPYEVIDKYGADILRYYMCGVRAGENINFNWEEVKTKQKNLFVFWNIHKYMIELYKEIKLKPESIKVRLGLEEKYILSKLNTTIKEVTKLFEEYKLDETIEIIEELFLDLSRTYIQLTREKATGKEAEKKVVLYTIYKALMETLKMFSTITPFACEKIYQNLKTELKLKEESIHHYKWPKYKPAMINKALEENMNIISYCIQAILAAREKAQTGVRWPLKKATIITQNKTAEKAINQLQSLIKKQTNTKKIEVKKELKEAKIILKENKAAIGADFKSDAPKILQKINQQHLQKIFKTGKCKIGNFELIKKHLTVKEELPKNLVSTEFKYGYAYIDTELTPQLELEGFAREITRRIQALRKKEGLKKTDKIFLSIISDYSLKSFEKEIKSKVGAKKLSFKEENYKVKSEEQIKDKKFIISFSKQ